MIKSLKIKKYKQNLQKKNLRRLLVHINIRNYPFFLIQI